MTVAVASPLAPPGSKIDTLCGPKDEVWYTNDPLASIWPTGAPSINTVAPPPVRTWEFKFSVIASDPVGGVTLRTVFPVTFNAVAWIVVLPGATPVTSPVADTVATEGEEEVQVVELVKSFAEPSL